MRALILIFSFFVPIFAQAEEPAKTDYKRLMVEQLAMRFRYPDRYMEIERGEPAPKDMAFGEMVRRGLIRIGTPKAEVEFLLGPSESFGSVDAMEEELNFGMMGGGLYILLDESGAVLTAVIHHDGDSESAHVDQVRLKPKEIARAGGPNVQSHVDQP